MAKSKAETTLLSFKFIATAASLWWAYRSYKKKEEATEAQLKSIMQPQPVTSTTSLAIPTGQQLPSQQTITLQSQGDSQLQQVQPTRPLDQLVNIGTRKLTEQISRINI